MYSCCKKKRNGESLPGGQTELPIDKGWAWVIVVGIYAVITGNYKSFGILRLKVLEEFPECTQDTSLWILQASSTVNMSFGAVVGILLTRFSHRSVGIFGSVMMVLGVMLTGVAPNCHFLFFSFSFVYAIGAGTLIVVCFTAFAPYFTKYRALAVAIMSSGSGLGGVILPPVFTHIFESFTYMWALILYGSLCLHCVIFAALLRPLSTYENLTRRKTSPQQSDSSDNPENGNNAVDSNNRLNESSTRLSNGHTTASVIASCLSIPVTQRAVGTQLLSASDVFESHGDSPCADATCTDRTPDQRISLTSAWRYLLQPGVLLVCILLVCTVSASSVYFVIIPSFATETGVNLSELSTLISVTSAIEAVSIIINGHIADMKVISIAAHMVIVLVSSGISAIICAAAPSIIGFSVLYTTMSLLGLSVFSLLPIAYIELVGVDRLPLMTGIGNVCQGLGMLITVPIANALYRYSGSWQSVTYYQAGCFFAASCVGIVHYWDIRLKDRRS